MHVWILGAGFSARLGGPLLKDLLTPSALSILRVRHAGSWLDEVENDLVIRIFTEGIVGNLWRDAEDFLTALSSYDSVHERDIGALRQRVAGELQVGLDTGADLEILGCVATALVAAQCMDFSERIAHDREAWLPYDRWAKSIAATDVIVSFNYDSVVERAFQRCGKSLDVPNPRLVTGYYRPKPGMARLLKLHGGVEFRDTVLQPVEPHSVANLRRNPAFIATPGASKADLTETDLDDLWNDAAEVVAAAESVSVVGYSCPLSDEKAKAMLLDTLAANTRKPPVDLVLGPAGDGAVVRLTSLLALAGVKVTDTKMWAEDYLSAKGVGHGWLPQHDDEGEDEDASGLFEF